MKKVSMGSGLVLWAILFLSAGIGYSADFLDLKQVKIGEPVPDFTLESTHGTKVSLSNFKGKVVMMHFWSAACPFVLRYNDRLNKIASDYGAKGAVILGINSNSTEDMEQTKKTASERGIVYPILMDSGNKVADIFGAVTTPHVYILDPNGVLVYEGAVDNQGWSKDNPVTKEYVREVLDAVMQGLPSPYRETKTVGCTVKRI